MLRFIPDGLQDFSASRSVARARGWGIPVPDDPGQVIYVWWDALGNYITALGYGSGSGGTDGGELYARWWGGAGRRIHLAGKGVVRFHAAYWPAILLSAGLPLPTDILVHDYLTIHGRKISKSGGADVATDPVALAERFGADAVRWWLPREVPRVGDADFTVARLIARAIDDLANGLGNLVSRVTSMAHRVPAGPAAPGARGSRPWARAQAPGRCSLLAGQCLAGSRLRWPATTSGRRPARAGMSLTWRTAMSGRPSPGSWQPPSGLAT